MARNRGARRIVALLQTYNEQRFIARCLDHLDEQGIEVYLVDNESTDDTVAIAESRLKKNLIAIDNAPRSGHFALRDQLRRKEQLAAEIDTDWFIHLDADELRVSSLPGRTLAESIGEMDDAGYNAVNFIEFVFLPTLESPDHDHPQFAETMLYYHPYTPRLTNRLNAWRRQDGPVELTRGGHVVSFPGLRMAPLLMYSRHYLFLSLAHAQGKFGSKRYSPEEVSDGWHKWRARVDPSTIRLPSQSQLRRYEADHLLNAVDGYTSMNQFVDARPASRPDKGWFRRAVSRGSGMFAGATSRTG